MICTTRRSTGRRLHADRAGRAVRGHEKRAGSKAPDPLHERGRGSRRVRRWCAPDSVPESPAQCGERAGYHTAETEPACCPLLRQPLCRDGPKANFPWAPAAGQGFQVVVRGPFESTNRHLLPISRAGIVSPQRRANPLRPRDRTTEGCCEGPTGRPSSRSARRHGPRAALLRLLHWAPEARPRGTRPDDPHSPRRPPLRVR